MLGLLSSNPVGFKESKGDQCIFLLFFKIPQITKRETRFFIFQNLTESGRPGNRSYDQGCELSGVKDNFIRDPLLIINYEKVKYEKTLSNSLNFHLLLK